MGHEPLGNGDVHTSRLTCLWTIKTMDGLHTVHSFMYEWFCVCLDTVGNLYVSGMQQCSEALTLVGSHSDSG